MVVDAPQVGYNQPVRSTTSLGTRKPLPRDPQAASKSQSPQVSTDNLKSVSAISASCTIDCILRISHYTRVAVTLYSLDLDSPHFKNESGRPHALPLHQTTKYSIMTDQRPDLASNRHQLADWLAVSSDRVVTVEHPSIIKDIDKGLQSLGGEHHIKHVGQILFLISTMPCHLIDLL